MVLLLMLILTLAPVILYAWWHLSEPRETIWLILHTLSYDYEWDHEWDIFADASKSVTLSHEKLGVSIQFVINATSNKVYNVKLTAPPNYPRHLKSSELRALKAGLLNWWLDCY